MSAWRRWAAGYVPEIVGFVALAAAGALFMAHAVSAVWRGLSHADDAFVALAAKSLVYGPGYGLPNSSEEFVPFHVAITTGAPMILPSPRPSRSLGRATASLVPCRLRYSRCSSPLSGSCL